jgi:hypothetical protein
MSTATKTNPVESFQKKVCQDSQLRKQIETLKTQPKNKAINEIVRLAVEAGFMFTTKEYEEYARTLWSRKSQANRPMTDEELILAVCNG